jgi:hypothetical protein
VSCHYEAGYDLPPWIRRYVSMISDLREERRCDKRFQDRTPITKNGTPKVDEAKGGIGPNTGLPPYSACSCSSRLSVGPTAIFRPQIHPPASRPAQRLVWQHKGPLLRTLGRTTESQTAIVMERSSKTGFSPSSARWPCSPREVGQNATLRELGSSGSGLRSIEQALYQSAKRRRA